jgi:hypothetical protein
MDHGLGRWLLLILGCLYTIAPPALLGQPTLSTRQPAKKTVNVKAVRRLSVADRDPGRSASSGHT